jgi:hypothetical protein
LSHNVFSSDSSLPQQRKGDQGGNPKRKKSNGAKDATDIDNKLGFLVNPESLEAYADPMEPKYCFCKSVDPHLTPEITCCCVGGSLLDK